MNYYATKTCIKLGEALPPEIKKLVIDKHALLKGDPRQLSQHIKRVGELWSVQINTDYRLLGTSVKDGILFFWIGARKK